MSLFPPPSRVFPELVRVMEGNEFWRAMWATIEAWGAGLLIGTAIALPLGIVIGSSKWLWRSLRVVIEALRPLPAIALLPLLLFVIGINIELTIFLVMLSALWPMLIQTMYGVQDVDPVAMDMARVYRLGPVWRFRYIVLPSTSSYIATGLRVAAVISLTTCIAVEVIVGVTPGIGTTIIQAEQVGRIEKMYAYVFASGMLGLLINVAFRRLERRVLFWHSSQRGDVRL
jgi:ABC-type nitrate/sulfonate/bicarbonate transport system permease component